MTHLTAQATVWLFYIIAPHVGIVPVPNSPGFTDLASCERALDKADPFLPGKTACWPAPWHYEDNVMQLSKPDAGEHVD